MFADVDRAVAAARQAYLQLKELPLSVREHMISRVRRAMRENAQPLAHEAWVETGMGRFEDKIEKVLDHVCSSGVVGLVLPAMTLFKSDSETFRKRFFQHCAVWCVANFANLAYVLFAGRAQRPAAAFFYRPRTEPRAPAQSTPRSVTCPRRARCVAA